ncbi:MAG: hypothetical protein IJ491_00220 [Clostridia bacterium]|nr:hypothetical protein [Clostridia bacterium]
MQNNVLSAEKEMELINRHSTVKLTPEKVFCFTVTLCDNEIDRDFERFTVDALKKLSVLFIGKTGISDHSMRSKDQMARIFHTYLEADPAKKNTLGEAYVALKARAYMLRTEENNSLISEIEGGIKKEVSISCSVNESTCSLCSGDMKTHSCKHIKGRSYNGKLCYAVLNEPTDAYEWSFVAVPAQRNAGVTKSYIKKEDIFLETPIEIIKSMTADTVLSDAEIKSIRSYVSQLEALAEDARIYKSNLIEDIERLALILMPKVNFKSFISSCGNLSAKELKELRNGLDAQAKEKFPMTPQLRSVSPKEKTHNNTSFKI